MARVLVVDDDPTVREVVVSYLRAAGHQVDETGDGESVAALMRDNPADLVVLDLMLPGIDGLEVCRRLRAGRRPRPRARSGRHRPPAPGPPDLPPALSTIVSTIVSTTTRIVTPATTSQPAV